MKPGKRMPRREACSFASGHSLFNALLHALQGISPLEQIIRKASCRTSVFIAIALSPDSSERNNLLHAAEERQIVRDDDEGAALFVEGFEHGGDESCAERGVESCRRLVEQQQGSVCGERQCC